MPKDPSYVDEETISSISNGSGGGGGHPTDSATPSSSSPSAASSPSPTPLVDIELGSKSLMAPSSMQRQHTLDIETIPPHRQMYIQVQNLSAYVPTLFNASTTTTNTSASTASSSIAPKKSFLQRILPISTSSSKQKQKLNQILYDMSACVRPGEVLALLGPSGSGKTTFLSILGGRAQKTLRKTGRILYNGEPLNKSMKRKIGYVMQDDLLYESLTVYETLYYAAMLRLPRDMPREAKLRRIDAVVACLGLGKCKDTIVGGFFRRGISGGERKRTSIGHELLINPSTLYLDEPTSGLDATTAMHLLETLRSLAAGGRAIVTTIHQPSSRLYQQLDKLLLLSGGHVMFYGSAHEAVDYFERVGYPIPRHVSTADFILDLASGEVPSVASGRDGEASRRFLVAMMEKFLSNRGSGGEGGEEGKGVPGMNEDGWDVARDRSCVEELEALLARGTNTQSMKLRAAKANLPTTMAMTTTTTTASFRKFETMLSSAALTAGAAGNKGEERWGASFGAQIWYLLQRSLKTRRFESLSSQDLCQFAALAFLISCFWWQKGAEQTVSAAREIEALLFFLTMFLSFKSLFVALFTFPTEQKHMCKERSSGLYRLSAFYIARMLSDFPMDLSIPSAFIIIIYFTSHLRYSAAAFFGIYGTLLLSMFVAQSLGLLLGSYFMNPKTSQTVAAVLMLAIVLTGGFFIQSIPSWIAWLKWLSYIYYSLGLLMYLQYDGGNGQYYSCTAVDTQSAQCVQMNPADPSLDPRCVQVDNLQAALGLVQGLSQGEAVRNGMVLLGFLVALRIAVYYVLRQKTSSI